MMKEVYEINDDRPLGCNDHGSLMELVEKTRKMLDNDIEQDRILERISDDGPRGKDALIILDMASTRKKIRKKFKRADDMFFTSEGLRWATPETAADHCAGRMEASHVMDITCGQGGQSISFADRCESVTAVDIDPLNCLLTKLNCISLDIQNVDVVEGDCLSEDIVGISTEETNIFCDPARPSGSRERTMDEIRPDPREVFRRYSGKCSGMCFEIPPYMTPDKIPFDCEREYISINKRLNRLNLYLGPLKESRTSCVILPEGSRIKGDPHHGVPDHSVEGRMVHELDPSIVKAGLVITLIKENGWKASKQDLDDRRSILWSDGPLESPFITQGYRVIGVSDDPEEVRRILYDNKIGSVTLRFRVSPARYWNVRNTIERGLKGPKKAQLFKGDSFIVTVKNGNDGDGS